MTDAPWSTYEPSGWTYTYLGHVVDVYGGATPNKDEPSYWNGTIPWVTPKDMKVFRIADSEDHVSEHAVLRTSLRKIPPGAVLIVTRGMILNHTVPVAVTTESVTINQDIKALIPRSGIDGVFLAWLLLGLNEALLARVEEAAHGTRALRSSQWKRLPVSIPPLASQRRIAKFLENKTASIDELVAKKENLILRLEEMRRKIVSQSVTMGLDPAVVMKRSSIQWAPDIPAHWEERPIKRLARDGRKTFSDGDWIETPFITDHGIRLIQTGNVGVGHYKEQGFRYISEESFAKLRCTEVHPGDVLICRLDGPVGRACLAPNLGCRMVTSVDNAILKTSADIDPRFVVYALSSSGYLDWVQALGRVGGGFRVRISRMMLGDFRIPVPPKKEQADIADYLDITSSSIRATENRLEASLTHLREYRQSLVVAAVTGKMDLSEDVKHQLAPERAAFGINTIRLKNFRGFETLELTLHPYLTLIIGENGAGKSAVLDALAIAMGALFLALPGATGRALTRNDLRHRVYEHGGLYDLQPQWPGSVSAHGYFDGESLVWTRDLRKSDEHTNRIEAGTLVLKRIAERIDRAVQAGAPGYLPILAYYGTQRLSIHKSLHEARRGVGSRYDGYADALEPASSNRLFTEWMYQQTLVELQNGKQVPQLRAVERAVCESINEATRFFFDLKSQDLLLERVDGERLPFSFLSDGYRNMVALVADIAWRAAVLNPQLGEDAASRAEGLVLIDEIDLHLHPRWQRRVLGDLRRTFPRLQFVVTTHSPQVIASARRDEVRILSKNVLIHVRPFVEGRDTNSLLEDVFGVCERPEEVRKRIDELSRLLDDEEYEKAADLLGSLEERLGPDDPAVIRARWVLDRETAGKEVS